MEDFCRNFSDLDICCSDANVLAGSHSSSWKSEVHRGQWLLGTTAGGCSNDIGNPTLIILQLFLHEDATSSLTRYSFFYKVDPC